MDDESAGSGLSDRQSGTSEINSSSEETPCAIIAATTAIVYSPAYAVVCVWEIRKLNKKF